jgi:hypothetical protein
VFRRYQYASKTFRGMGITAQDLEVYAMSKIVITRSFLSTSKNVKSLNSFLVISMSLIVPFIAFEITAVKQVIMKGEGIEHQVQEIELVECRPKPK